MQLFILFALELLEMADRALSRINQWIEAKEVRICPVAVSAAFFLFLSGCASFEEICSREGKPLGTYENRACVSAKAALMEAVISNAMRQHQQNMQNIINNANQNRPKTCYGYKNTFTCY